MTYVCEALSDRGDLWYSTVSLSLQLMWIIYDQFHLSMVLDYLPHLNLWHKIEFSQKIGGFLLTVDSNFVATLADMVIPLSNTYFPINNLPPNSFTGRPSVKIIYHICVLNFSQPKNPGNEPQINVTGTSNGGLSRMTSAFDTKVVAGYFIQCNLEGFHALFVKCHCYLSKVMRSGLLQKIKWYACILIVSRHSGPCEGGHQGKRRLPAADEGKHRRHRHRQSDHQAGQQGHQVRSCFWKKWNIRFNFFL